MLASKYHPESITRNLFSEEMLHCILIIHNIIFKERIFCSFRASVIIFSNRCTLFYAMVCPASHHYAPAYNPRENGQLILHSPASLSCLGVRRAATLSPDLLTQLPKCCNRGFLVHICPRISSDDLSSNILSVFPNIPRRQNEAEPEECGSRQTS